MHTKTMEGLVGARTNVDLLNTPMQVYKEAETRGDTAVMERALGYAGQTAEQADKYKAVADTGMEEDAKETKEKADKIKEEGIQKRKEEQAELEQRIEKKRQENRDTVQISDAGRESLPESANAEPVDLDLEVSPAPAVLEDPVTYTKTGEVSQNAAALEVSLSLTV